MEQTVQNVLENIPYKILLKKYETYSESLNLKSYAIDCDIVISYGNKDASYVTVEISYHEWAKYVLIHFYYHTDFHQQALDMYKMIKEAIVGHLSLRLWFITGELRIVSNMEKQKDAF